MQLHDYQHELLERVRQELRAGKKSVLVQLPTGGGKTVITASMLGNASKRGVRSAFGVHRRELIKQSIDTFNFVGIKHGIISAGWHPNRRYPVQIASIPTWMRRTKRVGNFDLIVWDECHHLRSASWSRLHADYPDAVHIGLTATPERLDGKGMGTHFDTMVCGPSTAELIRRGYLSPFRLFSVPSVITDGLHKNMGDFAKGELLERMNASTVTGDAIAHYKRHAPGRRAVLFEASVERSERAAEAFRQAGIPAVHVDGNSTDEDRDRAVRDFAAGDIRVLCNVDLFGEGFDLPAMEAVILCRPTHSLALYLQQVGRGLRIAPGKTDCIARDTPVLTDCGLIPIQDVTLDHKVWDGASFVRHRGAVCRGVQTVIEHDGLCATPDHRVMTAYGWMTHGEAAYRRIRITRSGFGGQPLRVAQDSGARNNGNIVQPLREGAMHHLFHGLFLALPQHEKAPEHQGVSSMFAARSSEWPEVAVSALPSAASTLHQPVEQCLRKIRWAWNKVQVLICERCSPLDCRKSRGAKGLYDAVGPHRQRLALRAWEPAMGKCGREYEQHANGEGARTVYRLQTGTPRNTVRRHDTHAPDSERDGRLGDRCAIPQEVTQTQGEVWDILEAGPLQRFTANGCLVHNCIILDHAGNFNRHGSPDAERRWTLEGRVGIGGGTGEAAVTNRVCTFCFATSPPTYTKCRSCGKAFPVKSRAIEEVEGELTEVAMTAEVQRRFDERDEMFRQFIEGSFEDFDELVREGKRRGYRSPESWAMYVIEGRQKQQRRATA